MALPPRRQRRLTSQIVTHVYNSPNVQHGHFKRAAPWECPFVEVTELCEGASSCPGGTAPIGRAATPLYAQESGA